MRPGSTCVVMLHRKNPCTMPQLTARQAGPTAAVQRRVRPGARDSAAVARVRTRGGPRRSASRRCGTPRRRTTCHVAPAASRAGTAIPPLRKRLPKWGPRESHTTATSIQPRPVQRPWPGRRQRVVADHEVRPELRDRWLHSNSHRSSQPSPTHPRPAGRPFKARLQPWCRGPSRPHPGRRVQFASSLRLAAVCSGV